MTTERRIKILAAGFADDIFTNGINRKANRLVLMHEPKEGEKTDLGGYCQDALAEILVDFAAMILKESTDAK